MMEISVKKEVIAVKLAFETLKEAKLNLLLLVPKAVPLDLQNVIRKISNHLVIEELGTMSSKEENPNIYYLFL